MNQKQVWRHLARFLRPVRGRFAVSLALLVVVALLTAAKAYLIQPVVDGFLTGRPTTSDLWLLCAIVAGVFLVQAFAAYGYQVVARMASARLINRIRADLFRRLTKQSLAYFAARPSADLLSRVVHDVGAFEGAAVGAIQSLMRDVLIVVLLIAVMVTMDPVIALFCVAIVAVTAVILRRMSRRVSRLGREVQSASSDLNRSLAELIGGMDLVLGFGMAKSWRARFSERNEELYRTQLRQTRVSEQASLYVLAIAGLAITALLAVTGYAVLRGTLTAGEFAAMLGALHLMQQPALSIGRSVANLSRGLGAVSRALELLQHQPTVVDPDEPRALGADTTVAFEGVGFRYDGHGDGDRDRDTRVLRDVSFRVAPGELVAVIGDSGAGKSTVAKLLMRFYDPQEGAVRIGGVALCEVAREDLYRTVSYVPQDIFLFDDTVEFNLCVGNPAATRAQVDEAVRIACVDEFLDELPEGLATPVGERGAALSGGQRQRIAIARAILADTRILVLDEATSALDMHLEQRILENLVRAGADRTIIAVTHRLTLAAIADRILVLKEGALAEEGDAATLALRDGEFARLRRAAERKLERATA